MAKRVEIMHEKKPMIFTSFGRTHKVSFARGHVISVNEPWWRHLKKYHSYTLRYLWNEATLNPSRLPTPTRETVMWDVAVAGSKGWDHLVIYFTKMEYHKSISLKRSSLIPRSGHRIDWKPSNTTSTGKELGTTPSLWGVGFRFLELLNGMMDWRTKTDLVVGLGT